MTAKTKKPEYLSNTYRYTHKLDDFLKYYSKQTRIRKKTFSKLLKPDARRIFKDLCREFRDEIIDGGEISIPRVGRIRAEIYEARYFKSDGRVNNNIPVNWPKTRAYWKKLYGEDADFKSIPDKPLIKWANENSPLTYLPKLTLKKNIGVKYKKFFLLFARDIKTSVGKAYREKTCSRAYRYLPSKY